MTDRDHRGHSFVKHSKDELIRELMAAIRASAPADPRYGGSPSRARRGRPGAPCEGSGAIRAPEEGARALAGYTNEQLELLIGFLRGSIAYQEERMRRLEAMNAGG
jgi:hypothetical protein